MAMDDPSLWRFADILPERGFAFHRISTGLTCASFDTNESVMLNTATLFFPQESLADFPFDILVLSRPYKFYFGITQREGVLFRARCNVYPRTVRRLPWSDALVRHKGALQQLRKEYLSACRNLHRREEVLADKLKKGNHSTLPGLVMDADDIEVSWSDEFAARKSFRVAEPSANEKDGWWVVHLGDDLFGWVAVNNEEIAASMVEGLALHKGLELSREDILSVNLPTPGSLVDWQKVVADFDSDNYQQSLDGTLDKVDALVADAFELTDDDLAFIRGEMTNDPMLQRIRPNQPYSKRKLKGLRTGLESSDRYDKAYKTRT